MKQLCIAMIWSLLAAACGGDEAAPVATVESATPDTLDPSRDNLDDLTILVEYADGDGDLGDGIAEVHDCRADDLVIVFDIPPIATQEAVDEGVPIEGLLELIVNDVGEISIDRRAPQVCEDLGVEDPVEGEVTFCVVLTDAAGNVGDGDCTAPVLIEAS